MRPLNMRPESILSSPSGCHNQTDPLPKRRLVGQFEKVGENGRLG
jgi:hypothetical protein